MKRTDIEQLLPGILQRTLRPGQPLAAVLETMEALHEPSEDVLARLDEFFNPRRTRDDFVPMLARWVDLGFLLERPGGDKLRAAPHDTISTGLGRLRELIACAAELSKWTGTAAGLRRFLEIATGEKDFKILENRELINGTPQEKPFHLTVVLPETLKPHQELIRRIVESEKPAYVTCDVIVT